ncbi:MAG: ubiquinol-cytochrome c reductase iron-sulfur subunit [Actinomycetota bacterium]
MSEDKSPARPEPWIAISFGTSALASLALTIVYALGGHVQAEGALLAVALGGLAAGLILWAKKLMPVGGFVEERKVPPPESRALEEAEEAFGAGAAIVERRSFLAKMLGAAAVALGVAALFPIRSLGTRPGRSLFVTSWRAGLRVVDSNNVPIRVEEVPVNGVLTVFPEDHTDAADSATLLIRLPPGDYDPPPGREDWSPEGLIAFSKICTHAGCPVGLYQSDSKELFCPCHQSAFAVLQAATPTRGPATRSLPQLPLSIDGDYIVAQGDFPVPVGPGFWNRGRA